MTRYTITLPIRDNDGTRVDHAHTILHVALLDVTGGYTAEDVRGVWRADNGAVYHDLSIRYEAIGEDDHHERLLDIARAACADARQERVLFTAEPVDVEFVEA